MDGYVIIALLHLIIAFLASFFLTRWWIAIAIHNKLVGKDMNKASKHLVAEAGGIAVIMAFLLTVMLYIFFKTFVLNSSTHIVEILAVCLTMALAGFIGFVDDILGWKKGLKGWQKLLMTLPIAIPLAVINAGHSKMAVPLVGTVDFGLLYPLLFVPLGIIGATNGYNLLAGYNGLEAGLGIVIFSGLGIISLFTGQFWLALIAAIIIVALLGFLIFNSFPAKVFPGDSLTYSLGALIACFAILGNMERLALLLFLPFIIEGFIKLSYGFKAENFAKVNKDNSLDVPGKINSMTHLAIWLLKKLGRKKKVYEQDVVLVLLVFEILLLLIALWVVL